MATIAITKGYNDPSGFVSGEVITPAKLNSAQSPTAAITFSAAADTDDSTLEVSGGKFRVKDAGVTAAKLAASLDLASKTVTLPDTSVGQSKLAANVAGNGPAFRAYGGTTTSLPNNTVTKVNLTSEEFDTNNNFASSRFTPTVAGYYYISGAVHVSSGALLLNPRLEKNGSNYAFGQAVSGSAVASTVAALIYLNGTTDYVELYVYHNSGGTRTASDNSFLTYMDGCLVRAA
jgi:hypothetical protein